MRELFAATLLLSLDGVNLLVATLADMKSKPVAPDQVTDNSNVTSQTKSAAVKARHRFEKAVHARLIISGFAILGLHLSSAGDSAELVDCMVRVRPWLVTKPMCAAMKIDCSNHVGMVGAPAELEARWAPLDTQANKLLVVTNCPKFCMPASIRSLHSLMGLYNTFSTVLEWSESAALSKVHHPNLQLISLGFLNMTSACDPSSSLPPGLLARDFLRRRAPFLLEVFRSTSFHRICPTFGRVTSIYCSRDQLHRCPRCAAAHDFRAQ